MTSPKKQYLKSLKTDSKTSSEINSETLSKIDTEKPSEVEEIPSKIDAETPLLVLERSSSKVMLRVFFWVFIAFLCYFIFKVGLFQEKSVVKLYLFKVFSFFMFVVVITITINELFLENFKLYQNRAEQNGVFGLKTVYLKDADISVRFLPNKYKLRPDIIIYIKPRSSKFYCFWRCIALDLCLAHSQKDDFNNFINCCKSIGIEFFDRGAYWLVEKKYKKVEVVQEKQSLMSEKIAETPDLTKARVSVEKAPLLAEPRTKTSRERTESEGVDNKTPLLELKYSPMKVLRFLVLVCIPTWVGTIYFAHRFVFSGVIDRFFNSPRYPEGFLSWILGIICCGFFSIATVQAIVALFMRSFNVYANRIEKCYEFWGTVICKRTLFLKDVQISIPDVSPKRIAIILKDNYVGRRFKQLTYQVNLGYDSDSDVSNFVRCCQSIGIEFLKVDTGKSTEMMSKERYEATEREEKERLDRWGDY